MRRFILAITTALVVISAAGCYVGPSRGNCYYHDCHRHYYR
jgi:hypothetical protein